MHFDRFIETGVTSGRFGNASEVARPVSGAGGGDRQRYQAFLSNQGIARPPRRYELLRGAMGLQI